MNYVILDLEFNYFNDNEIDHSKLDCDNYKEYKNECLNEIIEIGAVKLDKYMKRINTFKIFIRPSIYKKINTRITELTGITDNVLKEGFDFTQAMNEFQQFVDEDSVVCSWDKIDIVEIIKNAHYYDYTDIVCLKEYIDLQEYCTKILGEKNSISLKNALCKFNINFDENKLHDALNDAIFTAEVFKKIYNFRIVKKFIITDIMHMPAINISNYENCILDENKIALKCSKCGHEIELEYPLKLHKWRFLGLGYCSNCKNKILQQVVVKKNLAGDIIYEMNSKILNENQYANYIFKFDRITEEEK